MHGGHGKPGAPAARERQPEVVDFLPGLALSRSFYDGAVRPLLDEHFPALPHAACLIGFGSEVLGFDTARSADHNWGPRLQLFAADEHDAVTALLADRLPAEWLGRPTVFPMTMDPEPRLRIEVTDAGRWLSDWLGFDPRPGVTLTDWLATPAQLLLEVTAGAVFHDGPGELRAVRRALAWYPDDVWRHVLACQWQRINREEALPGRCAEVGDEVGSLVIIARLVRDVMRLCLLMARRYPPAGKWLGTAFARLPDLGELPDRLAGALTAPDWPAREDHLVAAYRTIAVRHNDLGLTKPLSPDCETHLGRPARVLGCGRFRRALQDTIVDPMVRALPPAGALDQFVDSMDATRDHQLARALASQLA